MVAIIVYAFCMQQAWPFVVAEVDPSTLQPPKVAEDSKQRGKAKVKRPPKAKQHKHKI